jgi:diadenosine tetraphosphate (Ap4A) HIT family hydrolase
MSQSETRSETRSDTGTDTDCTLCAGPAGDEELQRTEVWRDAHWRLSMAVRGETLGFAYLEPLRHIPYLADLDGPEAATFGSAIARVSHVLREATGAQLVYAYVFGGGIPHLHVHLAPNRPAGVLNTAILTGEVEERKLPSGATEMVSLAHPPVPAAEARAVIELVRELMNA